MNGIELILRQIQTDVQSDIDRILGDAKEETERIEENVRALAEAEAAALESRNIQAARQLEERLVSAGRMESRKVELAAKQEMVEKAYARALEKLCAMPEREYTEVLVNLLVKASSSGSGEVIFSPADRDGAGAKAVELANQRLGSTMTVSAESRDIRGGFILRERNVEVNCAFETLVRLQKAETAGAVAKKLFPEE